MLLVKSFAILGTLVIALQLIHSVGFAMHVVGAGALVVLLLVLLRNLLVLARRILRSQSVASAINCFALVVPPFKYRAELLLSFLAVSAYWMLFVPLPFLNRSFVVFLVYFTTRICYYYYFHPRLLFDIHSC